MDIGLDQAVSVTDSYGHHWVHSDPMGGQMATDGKLNKKLTRVCFQSKKNLENTWLR